MFFPEYTTSYSENIFHNILYAFMKCTMYVLKMFSKSIFIELWKVYFRKLLKEIIHNSFKKEKKSIFKN